MKPLSLVIAGAANPHVPGYLNGMSAVRGAVKLLAFSDHHATRRANAGELLRRQGLEVPLYADFRTMLDAQPEAEAILVGSDNAEHLPIYREAFARGLHIYSMKVVTMCPEEGAELLELQKGSDRIFQVELELRYRPQFQKAREVFAAGHLGKLQAISLSNISQSPISYFPNWGVPELSYGRRVPLTPGANRYRGGALTDHPHPIDMIRWITGLEFAEVTALSARNQRDDLEVEDHLVFTARLTDGTPVMVNPSYSNLEERTSVRRLLWPKSLECNLKLFGDEGCYYADYFQHPVLVLGSGHPSPDRLIVEEAPPSVPGRPMLQRFADQVRGEANPGENATLEDGLAAVKVMNAAYESLYHGKTVPILS